MSKQLDYWVERAHEAINSELLADAVKIAEIERIVMSMYADIYKNLLAYYGQLMTSEGISLKEAKKIADTFDVKAFQAKAKQYVDNKDFSEKANKELKRYNVTMKVSREKLLKEQLSMIVTESFAEQEVVIKKHLKESVERTLKEQSGILDTDLEIKPRKVDAVINANFGKVNWSDRLWKDQSTVQKEVERVTSNVVLRGRHPNEYVAEFRKKTDQSVYNAKRLLITEAARVQTEAQRLNYLETLGEDGRYQYVAKIDERTSNTCRHLDGKIFYVKDMVPGVNAPPMHPNCRSTTVPYVGNWRAKFFEDIRKRNEKEETE